MKNLRRVTAVKVFITASIVTFFIGAHIVYAVYGDGTVDSNVKISDGLNGFSPSNLDAADNFGSSVANIGDLDGDGVTDLAVGAVDDENSDLSEGALYILFMNSNGTVDSNVKISDGLSGFSPSNLEVNDNFGSSVANIGDLDGDGVNDLAVGAHDDENGDSGEGAIYILFMNSNGTVDSNVKISDGLNGFSPSNLSTDDNFGFSVANIGDLDGDGVNDLAVGASDDENSQSGEGAIYILFMNSNGTVDSNVKIADGLSGFSPSGLGLGDNFGDVIANIGDLDGDGVNDLAVGARNDENSQSSEGAIYILFMNTDGTVDSNVKISDGLSGFSPSGLDGGDRFSTPANIGDFDGDGVNDLAVGAGGDENGDSGEGAVYILFMNTDGTVDSNVKISDGLSGFSPSGLGLGDNFGVVIANIGDLDGDGVNDLAVGAGGDENGDLGEGAVYILFMTAHTPSISVSESGGATTVTEGGATDTYTIVLATPPFQDVTVNISAGSGVSVSPSSLTFTTSTYATSQTVTVTATDDTDVEGSHTATISHSATSADTNFNGLSVGSVTATITDNDSSSAGGGPPPSSYVYDCKDPNANNYNNNILVIHDPKKCLYQAQKKTNQPLFSNISYGDLIKGSADTVYYYGADGNRYAFPNPKIYFTWYDNFSVVKDITDETLASIPLRGNVTYRPGVRMIKITSDAKVYVVTQGGVLHWISGENVAEELYGTQWSTFIDDIPDSIFASGYTINKSPIETSSEYDREAEIEKTATIREDKNLP